MGNIGDVLWHRCRRHLGGSRHGCHRSCCHGYGGRRLLRWRSRHRRRRGDGSCGRTGGLGDRHLQRERCERDLLEVALDGCALLHEIGVGESRRCLDGQGVVGQRERPALAEHIDKTGLHAVALAERDRVPQYQACFFVHVRLDRLSVVLDPLASELGEVEFLSPLDGETAFAQCVQLSAPGGRRAAVCP